jgi:hypothetical protein
MEWGWFSGWLVNVAEENLLFILDVSGNNHKSPLGRNTAETFSPKTLPIPLNLIVFL